MKKNLLLLCCAALFILGMAQTQMLEFPKTFHKERNLEKFNQNTNYGEQSLSIPQKAKVQSKNSDWWEPDTLHFFYYVGDPTNDIRYIFSYNAQGLKTRELMQYWQENQWVNQYENKYTYTYDANNNLLTELHEGWNNNQWKPYYKYTYTYDTNNNLLTELHEQWNNNQWEFRTKYTYTYDANNNRLTEFYEKGSFENWESVNRSTYTYDANNNLLTQLSESYNGTWSNGRKLTYTYDANNNLLTQLGELWDNYNGDWKNWEKNSWIYDANNNSTSVENWSWYEGEWIVGRAHSRLYYNNMQSVFLQSRFSHKATASYINIASVGIKENNLENILTLYPNPVSNILHIEIGNTDKTPEVKIYSIQGILLMNTKGNQIDVSSLPSGIYIVDINGVFRKVVKQ